MVDKELISAIRNTIARFSGVTELGDSEAVELLDSLARQYVADPAQLWWWTALRGAHETIDYGDSDGLDEVARIVPPQSVALMVITDDEPRPWPVFSGTIADLLAVLREARYCEYFLVDPNLRWIVFDTHHNSLVIAGSLIGGAKVR